MSTQNHLEVRGMKPFYAGIPIEVLRRIGLAAREGFYNYDKQDPWVRFYQTSKDPAFFLEMFNNCIEHVYNAYDEMVNGRIHEGSEDHLAHAAMNLIMIMWAAENSMLPNKNIALIQVETEESEPAEQVDYKTSEESTRRSGETSVQTPLEPREDISQTPTNKLLQFLNMKTR